RVATTNTRARTGTDTPNPDGNRQERPISEYVKYITFIFRASNFNNFVLVRSLRAQVGSRTLQSVEKGNISYLEWSRQYQTESGHDKYRRREAKCKLSLTPRLRKGIKIGKKKRLSMGYASLPNTCNAVEQVALAEISQVSRLIILTNAGQGENVR
ncbi:11467_t:CDS:2, partial [Funneliformis geosporum]